MALLCPLLLGRLLTETLKLSSSSSSLSLSSRAWCSARPVLLHCKFGSSSTRQAQGTPKGPSQHERRHRSQAQLESLCRITQIHQHRNGCTGLCGASYCDLSWHTNRYAPWKRQQCCVQLLSLCQLVFNFCLPCVSFLLFFLDHFHPTFIFWRKKKKRVQ